MKIIAFVLSFILFSTANAGTSKYLLGAMVGDPTGISGKYEIDGDSAADLGLSYSLGGRSGVQMHGDYLLNRKRQLSAGDRELDVYYGLGIRFVALNSGDDKGKLSIGPRAPIGLSLELADPTVELFAEIAGILDIAPATSVDIDLGIGARYRF